MAHKKESIMNEKGKIWTQLLNGIQQEKAQWPSIKTAFINEINY